MSWQYPKHICGHDGERYQAYGKHVLREKRLAAIEAHPCPDCRKAEAENAAIAAGLPVLSGSPKQIAWASDIRERALRLLSPERTEKIRTEPSARWWIDHRDSLDRI